MSHFKKKIKHQSKKKKKKVNSKEQADSRLLLHNINN